MEPQEKLDLTDRTRLRNSSLWIAFDWGGLMAPLAAEQENLMLLGGAAIESHMALEDERWDIKGQQRDRTFQLSEAEIAQARQIAEDKVTTALVKLAIQRATDEYTLAVRVYEAKVKALIMGAREYAAQVELEQLAVAESEAGLAVEKEVLHLKEVTAKIYYEYINRAMVEADIAKAQVQVAQAHVRAIMADIAAGEADIKLIEAQIQVAMAQADKATLHADVAMIFAEILTHKLSGIKLDIGQKDIAAGFGYLQSRLDDVLARLATLKDEEAAKITHEAQSLVETGLLLADQKATTDLEEKKELNARDVFTFTESQTEQNLSDEAILRQRVVVARELLSDTGLFNKLQEDSKRTWAELLVGVAERYVHKHLERGATIRHRTTHYISGE